MREFDKVFYVTSHGMAGDHWFDWLPKALNAHSDILLFVGESVRSKYLKERSRKERPPILAYTEFLNDVGSSVYAAVGECFAYRAYQVEELKNVHGVDVRWVNIVRHPYAWLHFYVKWRTSNMNLPSHNTAGIDHEWAVTCHQEFEQLPLKKYSRDDVYIWSAYQGMSILNRMVSDKRAGVTNIRLEALVSDPDEFRSLVHYLSRGRVEFEATLLETIYSWTNRPFRPNGEVLRDPQAEYAEWPAWKKTAFDIIVKDETREMFESFGYTL